MLQIGFSARQGRIYHMAFWASAQDHVDSMGPRLSQCDRLLCAGHAPRMAAARRNTCSEKRQRERYKVQYNARNSAAVNRGEFSEHNRRPARPQAVARPPRAGSLSDRDKRGARALSRDSPRTEPRGALGLSRVRHGDVRNYVTTEYRSRSATSGRRVGGLSQEPAPPRAFDERRRLVSTTTILYPIFPDFMTQTNTL
ncbi:hypothetical protein EVAR_86341_1 [Eumeta japonica]|uniref:Uncharacterized protein n=1 Tax=Eumeta variegata TaxID=151549 RepID=A0A4C1X740_EUMVA|nr:hypothetical protein EVAR_86341_1 [Eumeta japonica]